MSERSRRRLYVLCGVLVIVVAILVGQLVRLQVFEQKQWEDEGNLIRSRTLTLTAQRGRIWDRNGDLLADNVARYQVTADPGPVNINKAVEQLAPLLDIPPNEMRAKLAGARQQVMLATKLPRTTGEAVRNLDLWAVYATPYWQRSYPEHQLLSQVLGFVNAQGQGYYGVEGQYDTMLRGRQEVVQGSHDAYAQPSPFDPAQPDEPRSGVDLVLTIDRTMQALAEAELARALSETGAKSGTIIAMDPRTGAILAMTSLPTFDPNNYTETPTSRFVNSAVSTPYEPGSTFKVLTMAAALQEGRVTPDTVYNDTAWIEVGGQVIRNWDRKGHGPSTMIDLLANSLNVGAAMLATQMGGQTFYRYVQAFGIGRPTGIDLQGEASGSLRVPGDLDWHESDLATNSFGQGLSTTPLQLISAVAAVANDGVQMRPYVVAQKVDGPGQVLTAKPIPLGRVISAQTARTLTGMLEQAVLRENSAAHVPGYRIAGKTGTAQIPIPGGYDDPWTIASFVGYGPASNPRLIILVKLDRPTSSPYGGQTASPVFARLASRMFVLMGIPPDEAMASR
jgi:cell division protein FtsI/penicillin-binding protein 2